MPSCNYRLPVAALAAAFLMTACGGGSAGSASAASNALSQESKTTSTVSGGAGGADPTAASTSSGASTSDPTTAGTASSQPGTPAPGSSNPTNPLDPPLPLPTDPWTPGKPGRFVYAANSSQLNIAVYAIDASSGAITEIPGSPFPSRGSDWGAACTAVSPGGKFLYCTNNFSVSVFTIDTSTGAVAEIAGSPFANALLPSGITLNAAGTVAYEPNATQASVSAFQVDAATGALTFLQQPGNPFPADTDPVQIALTPNGFFAYCVNQGSNLVPGSISAYRVDASGALQTIDGSPFTAGTNPHSMTIDRAGRFAYVANFNSNTISAYVIGGSAGGLTVINGSPFAAGNSPQSTVMHPSGQFLYVSNYNGANANGSIRGYAVDQSTGQLTELAGSPFAAGRLPTALVIEGSGRFLYTSDLLSKSIWVYSLDATTGALTPVPGSPFAVRDATRYLAISE